MSSFKGDYLGFTYNGVHSSELGIVRTSNGSRFDENLLPTMQDKTVQIPGGDGTYYFGSYYTQRQISVSFAFDSLTEGNLKSLRFHFGDKKIHDLTFDENPYKTYYAKVTGTTTLKYIPFDEGQGRERIYKGEGTIQFTCYQPYAVCERKYLDWYGEQGYTNISEWADSSGLLPNQGIYDSFDPQRGSFIIHNPGVKETDWILTLEPKEGNVIKDCVLSMDVSGARELKLSSFKLKTKGNDAQNRDHKITINSKTNLIEGWRRRLEDGEEIKSGNLYNEYVVGGDFFKIPVSQENDIDSEFYVNLSEPENMNIDLQYNYYYY